MSLAVLTYHVVAALALSGPVSIGSQVSLGSVATAPHQASSVQQAGVAALQVGAPAPGFTLKDQSGKTHRLADYKGKTVVLAFYPKDDTPGCTAELCSLRDGLPTLSQKGVVVLGISVQDSASKKAFAAKNKLTFPLLADTDKAVTQAYGVLGTNGLAERVTVTIGPDGMVQNIDCASRLNRQNGKLVSEHATVLAQALADDWKAELGKPLPAFSLPNYDGTSVLSTSTQHDLTVFVFVSTKCSYSNDYNGRLAAFAKDYATPGTKRVRVVGINANTDEKPDAIAKHAKDNGLPYPIVKDEHNRIADHFQAQKTPEVWIVDQRGVVRYHGAIDDHFDLAQVKNNYLRDVVDALLEGKEPSVTETIFQGCTIKRERRRS